MITVELEGLQAFAQELQRFALQAHQAILEAIAAEAERILEASLPLVPVDTGLLFSTGMTERQPAGADIRFGAHGLAPYAAIVHERLDTNHPNGGQARFLAEPFFAATGDMMQRLALDMAARLRR